MIEQIQEQLLDNPASSARDLAQAIGSNRREVNQILHSRTDLFAQDPEEYTWTNREQQTIGAIDERPRGPFGPARDLIPSGQKLLTIDHTKSCGDALAMLLDLDYSAIPVTGSDARIIGVVTLESILSSMQGINRNQTFGPFLDNHVAMVLEHARYIPAECYIDVRVDWHDVQHVIVGTPTNPIGMLTVADVWQRLHDFSNSFVLVHEIEINLRNLIDHVIERHDTTLEELISNMHVMPGTNPPGELGDFTFIQYEHLMCSGYAGSFFTNHLGDMGMFRDRMREIRAIRNDVMHFRHDVVPASGLDCLRTFRLQLRAALAT